MSRFDYLAYDADSNKLQAEAKVLVQAVEVVLEQKPGPVIGALGVAAFVAVQRFIEKFGTGRPHSLALSRLKMADFECRRNNPQGALVNLEECYMWIGKLIRDLQIMRTMESEA